MDLLRNKYFNKRVLANKVYMEVITDRQHIHMNSTQWTQLTEFCLYLEKKNKITTEKTEHGLWIQLISNNFDELQKQKKIEQSAKHEIKQ